MKGSLDGSMLIGLMSGMASFVGSAMSAELSGFESPHLFKEVFYNIDMPMAVVGTNQKPVLVNPALERFFEYSEAELQRMTFPEFTHPQDISIDSELFNEIVEGKRERYFITKRWISKRGETVWGLLTVSVIRDDANKIIATIAVVKPLRENQTQKIQSAATKSTNAVESPTKDGFIITALREIALIKKPFTVIMALVILMFAMWLFVGGGMSQILDLFK